MSDALRKAAQDVVDAYNVPVVTIETENALIDSMNALRAAMQQPDDAKQRLLEIMRRNGLATGHGDTLKQVIDTLEVELTDVLSAARQNAARYRWLRDVSDTEFMEELSDTFFGEWDAVIDAAMQQEQKP